MTDTGTTRRRRGRGIYAAAAGLVGLTLFFAAPFAAWAGEVADLYEAEVPVMGQDEGERVDAVRVALSEVLVRVTGKRDAPSTPELQDALSKPMRYVQQFLYRDRPPANQPRDGAAPDTSDDGYTQALWVTFDPRALNHLLTEAGLPVWGRVRPATLLWLAVEDRGRRHLLGADTPGELRDRVREAARLRGVPILLPLLDLQDQRALKFSDVWGDFGDSILNASKRYEGEAVLVGRLFRENDGSWQSRWSFYQNGGAERWTAKGDQNDVVRAGIETAADQLAARFAQVLTVGGGGSVDMVVSDINSLDDYARAMRYLNGLDPVRSLNVARVAGDTVTFHITVRGNVDTLIRTIGFGWALAPVAANSVPANSIVANGVSTDSVPENSIPGSQGPDNSIRSLNYRLLP